MDRSLKAGQRSIIFKYSKQRRHLQKNITVISKRNPENQEEIQGKQLKLFTHTQTASSRSREKVFSFFLFSWRTTPARFCIFSPWSYKSFPSSKDYATRIECARNHHLCQRSSAKWTLNLEAIFSRIFCFCISINAFLICIIIMKRKKETHLLHFFEIQTGALNMMVLLGSMMGVVMAVVTLTGWSCGGSSSGQSGASATVGRQRGKSVNRR